MTGKDESGEEDRPGNNLYSAAGFVTVERSKAKKAAKIDNKQKEKSTRERRLPTRAELQKAASRRKDEDTAKRMKIAT